MKYILSLLLLASCAQKPPVSEQPSVTYNKYIVLMGQSNMKGHPTSPGPTIAADLTSYYNDQVGYINCAVDSTSMDQWTASLFNNCMAEVGDRLPKVVGVFWYQGESDAYSYQTAMDWVSKFDSLNSGFSVPVVFAQIATISLDRQADPANAYWDLLKANQAAAGGVYTSDLQLNSDGIHLNTESAIEVGHRLAYKFIGELQ